MDGPLGVPLPVRTSLTPPDRVYVTDTCADTCEDTCPDTCTDQVQNIYTEVPSEWPPLPPVPPHQYPNMPKPPPSCDTLVGDHCVEMSHEELERQVCTSLCTGKSFSEALIIASTNPQYDKRLFIDLPVQYMKTTSSGHVMYINCSFVFDLTFKTIYVH